MNLNRALERAQHVQGRRRAAVLFNDIEYELALGEPAAAQETQGELALGAPRAALPRGEGRGAGG